MIGPLSAVAPGVGGDVTLDSVRGQLDLEPLRHLDGRNRMLSIALECEVPPDRKVIVKMPSEVQPGKHELIVVINEQPLAATPGESSNAEGLNQLAGALKLTEDPLAFQERLRKEWE